MAQYEHPPIYKKAMDVAVYFEKIVKNFSRYNKYTLGSELRKLSRDIHYKGQLFQGETACFIWTEGAAGGDEGSVKDLKRGPCLQEL